MLLKLGDTGPQVSEVQKLLSLLGYDLLADGQFGPKTQRSLIAFQKRNRLDEDGVVGDKTYKMLQLCQKRTAKEVFHNGTPKNYGALNVITSVPLGAEQYIKQIFSKTELFVHFTAGGPAAEPVIGGWNADESRIATAFMIDRIAGNIYQTFNPDFWAFHLGIKGTNGALDKTSVGIEICSYGPLQKVNDKYYAWPNNWKTEIRADHVYALDTPFRGYSYFEMYTNAQLNSLEQLLTFLIDEYEITVQNNFDMNWFEFNQALIDNKLPGIWTHTNVRTDKSDSYPDKRLLDLLNRLAKKYN